MKVILNHCKSSFHSRSWRDIKTRYSAALSITREVRSSLAVKTILVVFGRKFESIVLLALNVIKAFDVKCVLTVIT